MCFARHTLPTSSWPGAVKDHDGQFRFQDVAAHDKLVIFEYSIVDGYLLA